MVTPGRAVKAVERPLRAYVQHLVGFKPIGIWADWNGAVLVGLPNLAERHCVFSQVRTLPVCVDLYHRSGLSSELRPGAL